MKKIKEYKYQFISLDELIKQNLCAIYSQESAADGWEIYAPPSPSGKGWLVVLVKYED